MAVAKSQIDEVLEVVRAHVPAGTMMTVLRGLAKTTAYAANKSFRETVDRMAGIEALRDTSKGAAASD